MFTKLGKDKVEFDAVGSQFESYLQVLLVAFARQRCPCGVAWDAVSKQSCLLKLVL